MADIDRILKREKIKQSFDYIDYNYIENDFYDEEEGIDFLKIVMERLKENNEH